MSDASDDAVEQSLSLAEPSPSLVRILVADILKLRKERDVLRAALRTQVIRTWIPDGSITMRRQCTLCCLPWAYGESERHKPGCPAAEGS